MKPAFVGLMIGGGTILISVGVTSIVAAAREARGATTRRLLGTPRNDQEGSAYRTCELCGAEVSRERPDQHCPLIEAFVLVRAESIRLNDRGAGRLRVRLASDRAR